MKKGTLSIGIAIPVTLITLTVLVLILMNQARASTIAPQAAPSMRNATQFYPN
jgi:hypothetical protein